MKKFRWMVLFLLVTMLVVGCGRQPVPSSTDAAPTEPGRKVTYTITVVDTDGKPVADAMVAMCQAQEGGVCYMGARTDESGVVRFYDSGKNMVPLQDGMKARVAGLGQPLTEEQTPYVLLENGQTELTLVLDMSKIG